ncbi:MAG: redoxin domain-containing protein [Bdellovibrionales bacterium]|nr:redoxin domain-containing protein [Bdellovibrionales bacterium]
MRSMLMQCLSGIAAAAAILSFAVAVADEPEKNGLRLTDIVPADSSVLESTTGEPIDSSWLREAASDRVLLVTFWTQGCYNCTNTMPWLRKVQEKFGEKRFMVIGIHSPEFQYEHDLQRVAAAIKKYQLNYPSVVDNDFSIWRTFGNRAWPTSYLVASDGTVRYSAAGEIHPGDERAGRFERKIEKLLQP